MNPGARFSCVLMTAILAAPGPAGAGEPAPKKQSPPAAAGWRAFRDPATGKLREPTPEEARELSRREARKSAAPATFEIVVHPDGTKSVDLKGAFAMSLVARRHPDGSITYECRDGRRAEK